MSRFASWRLERDLLHLATLRFPHLPRVEVRHCCFLVLSYLQGVSEQPATLVSLAHRRLFCFPQFNRFPQLCLPHLSSAFSFFSVLLPRLFLLSLCLIASLNSLCISCLSLLPRVSLPFFLVPSSSLCLIAILNLLHPVSSPAPSSLLLSSSPLTSSPRLCVSLVSSLPQILLHSPLPACLPCLLLSPH